MVWCWHACWQQKQETQARIYLVWRAVTVVHNRRHIYISSAFIYHFYYYYLGAGFNLSINTFIFFSPSAWGPYPQITEERSWRNTCKPFGVKLLLRSIYLIYHIHPYSILVMTSDRWSDGGGAVTVYFFTLSLLNSAPLYSVLSSQ